MSPSARVIVRLLTTPYSIHFLRVLHQNKDWHNFQKSGQRPIAYRTSPKYAMQLCIYTDRLKEREREIEIDLDLDK